MASTLKLTFADQAGETVTFSYGNAKANVSSATVKALVAGMIANKELWAKQPTSAKSAKIVTTSETSISLAD